MSVSTSLRRPTLAALLVGTRRVILSFAKLTTNSSSRLLGDFLLFDRGDLADTMGRIDDEFAGLETQTRNRFLRDGHAVSQASSSFR